MIKDKFHQSIFSIVLPFGLVFGIFIFSQWEHTGENSASYINNPISDKDKQRGAHVFGIVDSTDFQFLDCNNIEWVTIVPWGFQPNCKSPKVSHSNGDSTYILKSDSAYVRRINWIRSNGFKVMVKPHVWIDKPAEGKWRSDIFPTNDKNWELWKESYRDFIIRYLHVAKDANADMFCVGTEFTRLAIEKPAFWKELIKEIRSIYPGKLTYAANWYKEYEKITFWNDLDYIGIQAYFPLVEKEYPSVQEVSKGWNQYLSSFKSVSKKYNRKVIFTEMGYKSTSDSAIEPWHWAENHSDKILSNETQVNCYQAFFNTIWKKEWFAGVHLWQLRSDYEEYGVGNLDFNPQGKPAEAVIAKGFE